MLCSARVPTRLINRRPLGRTDLEVSALGFGGAPVGFAEGADHRGAEFATLVREAVELGVTTFDTAPDYRDSERLIGEALAPMRDRVVVATKVGRTQHRSAEGWTVVEDWSPAALTASAERSLRRLGGQALDILQLHSPPRAVIEAGEALGALHRLRERGLVRAVGISADGDDAVRALELGGFDVLQTSYSLLQQQPGRALLDRCAELEVGVIAKQPLANAVVLLSERPAHPDSSWKWDLARRMAWPVHDPDARLGFSLRWVLSDPRVATAIVGTSRLHNLRRNAVIASAPMLEVEAFAKGQAAFDKAHG